MATLAVEAVVVETGNSDLHPDLADDLSDLRATVHTYTQEMASSLIDAMADGMSKMRASIGKQVGKKKNDPYVRGYLDGMEAASSFLRSFLTGMGISTVSDGRFLPGNADAPH